MFHQRIARKFFVAICCLACSHFSAASGEPPVADWLKQIDNTLRHGESGDREWDFAYLHKNGNILAGIMAEYVSIGSSPLMEERNKRWNDINRAANAIDIVNRAAETNDPLALFIQSVAYEKQLGDSLEKHNPKVATLPQLAGTYDKGNVYAKEALWKESSRRIDTATALNFMYAGVAAAYPPGAVSLGLLSRDGPVTVDIPDALEHFDMAADWGNTEAMLDKALIHYQGYHVEKDVPLGVELMIAAANAGNGSAALELSRHYSPVERNHEKSVEFLTPAAERGHPGAQEKLAWYHYLGEGTERDTQKAFELFGAAAENGNDEAMVILAKFHSIGVYVDRDQDKAIHWAAKAAEADNREAFGILADFLMEKEDYENAFHWASKAAHEADDVKWTIRLGDLYMDGRGTERDEENAATLYEIAAFREASDAYGRIGRCYLLGIGKEPDPESAEQWLEMGAESGDKEAATLLCAALFTGEGLEKDEDRALELAARFADELWTVKPAAILLSAMFAAGEEEYRDKISELCEQVGTLADIDAKYLLAYAGYQNAQDDETREKALDVIIEGADNYDSGALECLQMLHDAEAEQE